jgi:hypothetical protein
MFHVRSEFNDVKQTGSNFDQNLRVQPLSAPGNKTAFAFFTLERGVCFVTGYSGNDRRGCGV